jgi:hypothetical protein
MSMWRKEPRASRLNFLQTGTLDTLRSEIYIERMQHSPIHAGGPCKHCGLTYSSKTAYVPCLEDGETLETWRARQNEAVLALTFDNQRAEKDK